MLAVTPAAQIATLPVIALTFHVISFISPLVNLLSVELLAALLVLGLLICSAGMLFTPLGILFGWAAYPLLWYVIAVTSVCARLQLAYLPVTQLNSALAWGYYALLVLLVGFSSMRRAGKGPQMQAGGRMPQEGQAVAFPSLSKRTWRLIQVGALAVVVLATGATAMAAQPDGRLTITFLTVGPAGQPPQGQAILIRTGDGKAILLDGGLDATSLSQELDSRLPPWQ